MDGHLYHNKRPLRFHPILGPCLDLPLSTTQFHQDLTEKGVVGAAVYRVRLRLILCPWKHIPGLAVLLHNHGISRTKLGNGTAGLERVGERDHRPHGVEPPYW